MQIKAAYQEVTEMLRAAGVSDPGTDAWLLTEHVTGITRAAYFMDPDRELTEAEERALFCLAGKRKERIPLQHLTGTQSFMGYEFLVNGSVLIPRQETEILAEEAARLLHSGMDILDLCTGSGCILLSLLKIAEERNLSFIRGIGTDLSKDALAVAERNAARLLAGTKDAKISAAFLEGDLLDALSKEEKEGRDIQKAPVFDLIVSNPPYIPAPEIETLQEEVRRHDPRIALDGGEDGLGFYRRIVKAAGGYMKTGGSLLFEIGWDQGEAVMRLMQEAGFCHVTCRKDLAGLDRVVSGVYDKE